MVAATIEEFPMRAFLALCLTGALVLAGVHSSAAAAQAIGVVLLHGKTGAPNQFAKLSAALTAAGYTVAAPEMCWSKTRIFDKPFPDCMKEVDAAVATLKSGGAAKVVVAGMSQGGIAVLDYGVTRQGSAGIVAMGSAGDPNLAKFPTLAASEKTATALINAGKGDEVTELQDLVNGKPAPIKATPNVFMSFHGPAVAIGSLKNVAADNLPRRPAWCACSCRACPTAALSSASPAPPGTPTPSPPVACLIASASAPSGSAATSATPRG